jgi:hypothetical protein
MSKSYNVVVNSTFCTSDTALNLNSNKNYYIDWSAILPQGEYELTFSFISEGNTIANFVQLPLIYADFLSQANVDAVQSGFQGNSSNLLGTIFPINLDPNAHICFFRADSKFNPPIFLANRPYSNNFNIKVLSNDNPATPWIDEATMSASIGAYVMILHFTLLKKAI